MRRNRKYFTTGRDGELQEQHLVELLNTNYAIIVIVILRAIVIVTFIVVVKSRSCVIDLLSANDALASYQF